MIVLRYRYIFFATVSLFFVLFTTYYLRDSIAAVSSPIIEKVHHSILPAQTAPEKEKPHPKYKPQSPSKSLPIIDNFPLAASARSAADLPPIPKWNLPPSKHVPEKTPLFIGFTRNWRLLQQAVVSYITSGWPAEDIYVIENTGVMESNKLGLLSLQNPFFLNHTRLEILGVNIIITPTLFTFAQLQNFYLWTSLQNKWSIYFWSHMDVVALSFEDQYARSHSTISSPDLKHNYSDYPSIYKHCVDALRNVSTTIDHKTGQPLRWAMRFFSYDRLALVNVASFQEVGSWDTLIPFYMTDCDMHARLTMAGLDIQERQAGMVFDVGRSLDDLIVLYRKKGTVDASFTDSNAIEEELAVTPEGEGKLHEDGLENVDLDGEVRAGKKERRDEMESNDIDAFAELTTSGGGPGSSTSSNTKWEDDEVHSEQCQLLISVLDHMQGSKWENPRGRNTWQARQTGGQGDPYYRDSEGFDKGIQMTIEHGRAVFREKWGHRDCDIVDMGLMPEDAWKVEKDWQD
jgi:hypothetical protein